MSDTVSEVPGSAGSGLQLGTLPQISNTVSRKIQQVFTFTVDAPVAISRDTREGIEALIPGMQQIDALLF